MVLDIPSGFVRQRERERGKSQKSSEENAVVETKTVHVSGIDRRLSGSELLSAAG